MSESSGEEDINGHELRKHPRGSPTPHQCQKRMPLREISVATNGTVQPRRLSNLCLSSSDHQPTKDAYLLAHPPFFSSNISRMQLMGIILRGTNTVSNLLCDEIVHCLFSLLLQSSLDYVPYPFHFPTLLQ